MLNNYTYEALLNDNVRFLQGTQAELNKYLPNYTVPSGETDKRGSAIEGAFYLTTDTHKLYIGRKVTSSDTSINGKVYPEEISAGLTVVNSTSDLTSAVTNKLVHDGDIYYVKDSNILCVYESGEAAQTNGNISTSAGWVQINAPTKVTGFNASVTNGQATTVSVTHAITTAASATPISTAFDLTAGDNITLTGNSTNKSVTIAATDTLYTVGTEATISESSSSASAYSASQAYAVGAKVKYGGEVWECKTAIPSGGEAWNAAHWTKLSGAVLELRTNGSDSNAANTKISIDGEKDIGVTSDENGNIIVKGPDFTNKGVAATTISNDNGFQFALEYAPGDGSANKTQTHSTKSTIDPMITYGTTGTINGNSYTAQTVHFVGDASDRSKATATLDIYTKAETNDKIEEMVKTKVSAFNAMEYMGTITQSGLETIKNANPPTGHKGDTYKASAAGEIGGVKWSAGDLIILNGQEYQNTDSTNSTTYTTTASLVGKIVPSTFSFDIIPSGDEPEVKPQFTLNDGTNGHMLQLVDGKKTSNNLLAEVDVKSGNLITVSAAKQGTTNDEQNRWVRLTVDHDTVTRTDSQATLATATYSATADDIGASATTFTVLDDAANYGITTDASGHITGVSAKTITFKHNRLKSLSTSYSNVTGNSLRAGLLSKAEITTGASDAYVTNTATTASFESSTLNIAYNNHSTASEHALAIDIKWGSF